MRRVIVKTNTTQPVRPQGRTDERGAALITALIFLVLLTALGIAAVMTGSTESKIAGNDRLNKLALDHANAGVHMAIAALEDGDLFTATRASVVTAADPSYYDITPDGYDDKDGNPVTLNIGGGIDFLARIKFKWEDTLHYVDKLPGTGSSTDHQIVGYCKNNGYQKAPITDYSKSFPVYEITSVGNVKSGPNTIATATVIMEVTKNSINVDVPAGLYTTAPLNINGGADVYGTSNCPGVSDLPAFLSPVAPISEGTGTINPPGQSGNPTDSIDLNTPEDFLGMSKEELISLAKGMGQYYEQGTLSWGNLPDPATKSFNEADYFTETNPLIIYVKPSVGDHFTLPANSNNYGILFVDGDMETAGNANWKGLIYVTGQLTASLGTVNIDGAVMAGGGVSTTIGGNVTIRYDCQRLEKIAQQAFETKIINWRRQYAY